MSSLYALQGSGHLWRFKQELAFFANAAEQLLGLHRVKGTRSFELMISADYHQGVKNAWRYPQHLRKRLNLQPVAVNRVVKPRDTPEPSPLPPFLNVGSADHTGQSNAVYYENSITGNDHVIDFDRSAAKRNTQTVEQCITTGLEALFQDPANAPLGDIAPMPGREQISAQQKKRSDPGEMKQDALRLNRTWSSRRRDRWRNCP